jgi:hypothetical protein
LFELGLQKQPLIEDLLERATPSYVQAIREKALQHLFDNFTSHYSGQYNPNTEVAFLPTTDGKFQTPLVGLPYGHSFRQCWASEGTIG